MFVTNAVAVLVRYGEEIVAEVCGPGTGLQVRSKWLPTVSEIREACEQAAQTRADRDRRAQLAQHRVLLNTPKGLLPEAVAIPILEEERKRMAAAFDALQADLRPSRKLKPPNMELLKPRAVEPASEALKATNAGRDWGAPDITYGPAPKHQEAAE